MVRSVATRASGLFNPGRDQLDHPTMSATSSLAPASTVASSLVPDSTPQSTTTSTDYRAYLSVIDLSSDEDGDEDLYTALSARASGLFNPGRDQLDHPTMSATSSLAPASTVASSLVPDSTPQSTTTSTDYRAYLSVIDLSSDEDGDEDLYTALSASMEDQM